MTKLKLAKGRHRAASHSILEVPSSPAMITVSDFVGRNSRKALYSDEQAGSKHNIGQIAMENSPACCTYDYLRSSLDAA